MLIAFRYVPLFARHQPSSAAIPSWIYSYVKAHILTVSVIQVICEKAEKSDIATIDKKKYLVPADLTVGQFVYVIRKRIKLSPEKAIFIFVDEVLPPTAALMSSIYEEHKDEDGFLYITYAYFLPVGLLDSDIPDLECRYSGENTFGDC